MGKNKEPQLTFRCNKEMQRKLSEIAKKETRSRNEEIKFILKQYIDQYEADHGEIKITEEGGGRDNDLD